MLQLDDWQKEYIAYDGDKILVAGRQTGKSEAQAYDNATFALNNPNTTSLLISRTERQSEELLIKTLNFIREIAPKEIAKGKDRPTKHIIQLKNKSRVLCLPTGLAGEGIRFLTIHKLSADEAQLIPSDVFTAVTPMLLTTGGKISLTGTPQGKHGFFWEAYENKYEQFKVFHINSEQVMKTRPISTLWTERRRKESLEHLEREKLRMSAKEYEQEYLGKFVEDLMRVFTDELIKLSLSLKRRERIIPNRKYYLGADIGRNIDPTAISIIDGEEKDNMKQVESIVLKKIRLTESSDRILELHKQYSHREIGIDGGGMGAGVVDMLLREPKLKSKVEDLNNARRDIQYFKDGKVRKKTLLKNNMYMNLLSLLEKGKLKLLDDDAIGESLASVQIEYTDGKDEPRIFGNNTHIAEGIIRAAWIAIEDKSLNIWCR